MEPELLSTVLKPVHEQRGASMTEFGGWLMPLRYSSAAEEHAAVRERAGMFDLSHMGQIRVEGPGAAQALDYSLINLPSTMEPGRARYSIMVDADGGILDDLIVYRNAVDDYLVIANASNRVRVCDELTRRSAEAGADVAVQDNTEARALIAVQGPASAGIVASAVDGEGREELLGLRYYRHGRFAIEEIPVHIARTGYTGERGYEIMCDANDAVRLWEILEGHGSAADMVPCGLAARDTLRLEAGMPLYGHELSEQRSPADVGLARMVKDHEFVGREGLAARGEPTVALYGLTGEGRRAARAGCPVSIDGEEVGAVTSGVLSPTLGYPIALAILRTGILEGTGVTVDVRGKDQAMTVTPFPFYTSTH